MRALPGTLSVTHGHKRTLAAHDSRACRRAGAVHAVSGRSVRFRRQMIMHNHARGSADRGCRYPETAHGGHQLRTYPSFCAASTCPQAGSGGTQIRPLCVQTSRFARTVPAATGGWAVVRCGRDCFIHAGGYARQLLPGQRSARAHLLVLGRRGHRAVSLDGWVLLSAN